MHAREIAIFFLLLSIGSLLVLFIVETTIHILQWRDSPVLQGCIQFGWGGVNCIGDQSAWQMWSIFSEYLLIAILVVIFGIRLFV